MVMSADFLQALKPIRVRVRVRVRVMSADFLQAPKPKPKLATMY